MVHVAGGCIQRACGYGTCSRRVHTEGMWVSGADPGFWEKGGGPINIFTTGGGYGRGRAPSRDSKGV